MDETIKTTKENRWHEQAADLTREEMGKMAALSDKITKKVAGRRLTKAIVNEVVRTVRDFGRSDLNIRLDVYWAQWGKTSSPLAIKPSYGWKDVDPLNPTEVHPITLQLMPVHPQVIVLNRLDSTDIIMEKTEAAISHREKRRDRGDKYQRTVFTDGSADIK
jgi:hypothetical protein